MYLLLQSSYLRNTGSDIPAMDLLRFSTSQFAKAYPQHPFRTPLRRCCFTVRSSLRFPFAEQNAKYYKELQAAVIAVEKACRLCVDVHKSLFSNEGEILEKNDQTPVTIADFGVQALISLEMGKSFPSIPLVAEEDSAYLRANNLVDPVVNLVIEKGTFGDKLMQDDVLKAIDRGGKDAHAFGLQPASYWVLDPIDGTRGFVKGMQALYVVGLALVVDGEIVLGVMGCPNWQNDQDQEVSSEDSENGKHIQGSGILMMSHKGCGTWRKGLNSMTAGCKESWIRCFVDVCQVVQKARFCIPESQTWESLPLSAFFTAASNAENVGVTEILLLSTCCGSLCKYLMVASGKASVFIQHERTRRTIKAWDHAVGIICVHEAGGKVTDWKGSQINFEADHAERRILFPSGGFLATNDILHNELLKMISLHSSLV